MTDQLLHLNEQERDVVPVNEPAAVTRICPYCDEPLDGETVNGLHLDCNREVNQEMEQAFGPVLEIIE